MHGLEKEYSHRITFQRINILNPENAVLMEQYSFSSTPEFYLVDDQGRILGSWDETLEADELRQAFENFLGY